MRHLLVSLFALSLFGCAVTPADHGDEAEADTAEESGALSAWGQKLTGAYSTSDKTTDFDTIVLKGDGTYFTEEVVECFAAPCPPIRTEGKFTVTKPVAGRSYGFLRLYPLGSSTHSTYRVILGSEHTSFKLSNDGGKRYAKYATVGTFCDLDADCEGQSYIHPMCVGFAKCDASTNKCGWKCGTKCDYSDPSKTYIGKSKETCMVIRYACAEGTVGFSDDCGCGCQAAPKPACKPTGCSGQICSDKDVISTCEYRESYACYKTAICERGADGNCGWRDTPELEACLESHL